MYGTIENIIHLEAIIASLSGILAIFGFIVQMFIWRAKRIGAQCEKLQPPRIYRLRWVLLAVSMVFILLGLIS